MTQTSHIKNIDICLDSLFVISKGKTVCAEYYHPYKKGMLHRMFSVSKSYTSLAIGALISENKLNLDDAIVDYFPELFGDKIQDPEYDLLKQMTIRNMLMMQTCFASTTYKNNLKENWLASFFQTKPDHAPGMIFNYDTSAALALSALVRKLSGKSVLDYLREIYLDKIGFSKEAYFMPDPFGTDNGGSGMMAYPEDLLITGRFLMAAYRGRLFEEYTMLLSQSDSVYDRDFFKRYMIYLKEAMSFQTDTVHAGKTRSERYGYGYFFWMLPKNGIMMYGMGGQYLILYPDEELIVVTTADTQSESGGTQRILDYVEYELLEEYGEGGINPKRETEAIPKEYFGEYTLTKNDSVFDGFSIKENLMCFYKKEQTYCFAYENRRYGNPGIFPDGLKYCAKAQILQDGNLYLHIRLIGEIFGSVHVVICRKNGRALLYLRTVEEYALREFNGFFDAVIHI